jgi:UDP-N-acetylmuramoyl-tripeptide--D-alanyl-D-alanine ligase
MAAIGRGEYFEISSKKIKRAIESYIPENKRSQLIQKENTNIILDAYNANPTSMQAALEAFQQNSDVNKVVILGDMFELGNSAEKEHQYIVDLASNNFDSIFLLGENFNKTQTKKAIKYRDFKAFKADFDKNIFTNTTVLIKGSRGMALERILDLL